MQYRADTLGNSSNYLARVRELNKKSWPEFLLYGDTLSWERIYDELADFLKENWTVSIRIEGHTDNQGDKTALQKLSEDRAEAIKRYLVYEKFIQPLRIETVGMGDKSPLTANQNERQRAKNRRVEVVITKINTRVGGLQTSNNMK